MWSYSIKIVNTEKNGGDTEKNGERIGFKIQLFLCETLCLLRVALCNKNSYTENHRGGTERHREKRLKKNYFISKKIVFLQFKFKKIFL